jgi:tRNA(fMet)-specific endonuclease VapC
MILIDTDVLIEMTKENIELPKEPLAITTITLYEFLHGAKDIDAAARIRERDFAILSETPESIRISAKIWQNLKKEGKIVADADLVIAGIAIANKIPLWTNNRRHFERFERYGLELYNPTRRL